MLHTGEFGIDDQLVADLIASQTPEWSHLQLARIDTSGTVNVLYRLGDNMLVRLPRLEVFDRGPLHVARWLPHFAPAVPLRIPKVLALGRPTDDYPSAWSITDWIPGENATPETLSNLNRAAELLGKFVLALRAVSPEGAPGDNNRGKGLARMDPDVRRYLNLLPEDVDRAQVLELWESCASAKAWHGPATWFHSDLHSGNLLAREGELMAVLDFEGADVGDPASDLIAAWWLFDEESRDTFLRIVNPDRASLQRGKGWALYMCITAIPYYAETNPEFVAMAQNALAQILDG